MKEDYDKFWSPAFDDMCDFVCLIDSDYNLVRVNKSFFKFFSKNEKDLIGKKYFEIFHASDKPFPDCPHEKMLSTKVCEKNEFFEPSLKRHLSVTATPIWSDDHKLMGSIHVTRDITPLKDEKEKLKIRNDFIDRSMTPFAVGDLDKNLIYVNSACLKLWGFSSDREVLGTPLIEFWKDKEKVTELVKTFKDEKCWAGELAAKKKDGTTFDCYVVASMITDSSNRPLCLTASFTDVTERNRMAKAIKESEEKYKTLIECLQEGIGCVDPDENIIFANHAFADMLGYKVDELVGKNLKDLTNKEEFKKYREETKKREEEARSRYETILYHKDGSPRYLSVSAAPLKGDHGDYKGTIGVVTDLTELKKLEEALQENKERYQKVIEGSTDCVYLLNGDSRLLYANKHALVLNEVADPKSFMGMPFANLVTARYRGMISDCIKAVLSGESKQLHYETVSPNKKHRWWAATFLPIRDTKGHVVNILNISRDLTVERESKVRAEFFKEYAENVLANVPISVLVVNRSGQITFANRNFLSKMKVSESEVIGMSLAKIVPADILAKANLRHQMAEVLKTRDVIVGQRFEYRGRTFLYNLMPLKEAAGRRHNVAIMMEDVTERTALEEQLRHSERLAMMGQFAAGVTHEINNPLAIIKGNVQYLRDHIKKGGDFCAKASFKELKETLAAVEHEATRCANITGELLHFAKRTEVKQRNHIDINHLVRHVLHLMKRQLSLKKIKLVRELMPGKVAVRGSHDLLQQVVMNLVLNAEQAMGKRGGVITIKTLQERRKAYMIVKDNGCGIPKEVQQFIFNPFFTTKGGGTGLGLSVVHSIVEDHGGSVTVKSRPKRGSVFTVALPVGK